MHTEIELFQVYKLRDYNESNEIGLLVSVLLSKGVQSYSTLGCICCQLEKACLASSLPHLPESASMKEYVCSTNSSP